MLKAEDQEIQHMEEVNELNEKHQVEIKSLKQENEELKHIAQAQKTEIRTQEHLVQVGAAVRLQAAEGTVGNLDPYSKYKDSYFKDLYTLSFSECSEHLNDDFRSYPLKKLEICEMSGTMTSLTGFSAAHKYEDKGLLNNFQALAIAADEEWAKQICHLWPDHQRRLNTANNWPPLEMIIREMRTIVEDSVERLCSRTSNSQFNPGRDWSTIWLGFSFLELASFEQNHLGHS
ncbi:hypothetical protein IFR04_003596 [Cadophora malorum]|uniref:Uncharacterized protein n=1 Tax=Cadophora malorum TaxID=108018 RepID=A0A8H8BT83_9HELO|nr:hypothetical protein IFR04_003596 [Cadophora malorum]